MPLLGISYRWEWNLNYEFFEVGLLIISSVSGHVMFQSFQHHLSVESSSTAKSALECKYSVLSKKHMLTGKSGSISLEHWWQKNLFGLCPSTAASAIFPWFPWRRRLARLPCMRERPTQLHFMTSHRNSKSWLFFDLLRHWKRVIWCILILPVCW